ncbi:polysaccharide biosynthesis/export family protein [Pseudorhodoplanes sp.]|uniref:polysaccharide biosynthesis/export family protein n=1 Tax=Pseudorhodoplanes sp. TaxID=1934341 RepID=UPI002C61A00F|nr:polysaccharide biosynthesis/export family protein [Pseudorhodoplanes sp.]HWV51834.1 polysaccharide biosynthesis/export family protein [Pseudorhodoplanes sp.]
MRPKAHFRRLTVLFAALALPACVHDQAAISPAALETAPVEQVAVQAPMVVPAGGPYAPAGLTGYDAPYQLDAGDRLRVQVFGQEGLTNSYIVDASGNISMTLIGSVPVRGLTTAQVSRAIADRLRAGYIRNPHVSVEVEVYRPFFILGEVNAPGQYPYVPNMTVEAAVAIAGGYAPRASKSDILLARSYNGETMRVRVQPDMPMRPGDTITVRERWF